MTGLPRNPVGPPATGQVAPNPGAGVHNNKARGGLALASVVVLGAIGLIGYENGSFDGSSGQPGEAAAAKITSGAACDKLTTTPGNTAFVNYSQGKFLPAAKGNITTNNQAADYVTGLFSSAGPLGGAVDTYSQAMVGTFAEAALETGGTDVTTDIRTRFRGLLKRLKSPLIGKDVAVKLCNDEARVLGQTFEADPNFIPSGTEYTEFVAVDGPNGVVGMRERHLTAPPKGIGGVSFKVRSPGQHLNGFDSVLFANSGAIDMPGRRPDSGAKSSSQTGTGKSGSLTSSLRIPAGSLAAPNQVPSGSQQKTTSTGGGRSSQGRAPAGGGSGSGGPVGPQGLNPESRPNGTATGPQGQGPSVGRAPEAAVGPGPSPGGGPGAPAAPAAPAAPRAPEAPAPRAPEAPAAPPAQPSKPPTETTTTPTQTTPPPTTTTPKGSAPPQVVCNEAITC